MTDKRIAENPGQIKSWLRAVIRSLIFIRENVEGATEVAIKRLKFGGASRSLVSDGIKRYNRALPEGVAGLPSAEALKNVVEYDVKIPLKLKEDVPVEKLMNLKFVEEVKRELEGKKSR